MGLWILVGTVVVLGICSVVLRPMMSGSIRWILGSVSGFVFATLVRFRALPFLQQDTIVSAGKRQPTAPWAAAMAKFLYVGSAIFLLVGLVWLFISVLFRQRIARIQNAATQND
jgi:hypothetical protein